MCVQQITMPHPWRSALALQRPPVFEQSPTSSFPSLKLCPSPCPCPPHQTGRCALATCFRTNRQTVHVKRPCSQLWRPSFFSLMATCPQLYFDSRFFFHPHVLPFSIDTCCPCQPAAYLSMYALSAPPCGPVPDLTTLSLTPIAAALIACSMTLCNVMHSRLQSQPVASHAGQLRAEGGVTEVPRNEIPEATREQPS